MGALSEKLKNRTVLAIAMIIILSIARLLPHPGNFTPIMAIALFGGVTLTDRRLSLVVILGSMFLSDIFLGFHLLLPLVYLCLIATEILGEWLRTRASAQNILLATIASTALFFIVTNFGVWLFQDMYPKTLPGLALCYVAGIPFVKAQLFGNLLYTAAIFGGFELLQRALSLRAVPSGANA